MQCAALTEATGKIRPDGRLNGVACVGKILRTPSLLALTDGKSLQDAPGKIMPGVRPECSITHSLLQIGRRTQ